MPKKKTVIASILKPVNDTRMYEKMGFSLANSGRYEVHIIGYSVKSISSNSRITFHPIFGFNRLSRARILAPITFYKKVNSLTPDTIIINTHELLFAAIWYKLLHKIKLVYDVRENYYRNILYTDTYPLPLRPILAGWVRFKEYMSRFFVDHYFLAEQYYEEEFSFTKGRSTVIENKFKPQTTLPSQPNIITNEIRILFSGTLSKSTGVFHAINLAKRLHEIDSKVRLNIIGYSPINSVIDEMKLAIEEYDFIELIGGNELVNHEQIITQIQAAHFGIICYPSNKSTINSTPTKLYEYLTNRLPIIVQNHPRWQQLIDQNQAGICIDFDNYDASGVLTTMHNEEFFKFDSNGEFLWDSEEQKLLNILNN